jgi:hypothetical protein
MVISACHVGIGTWKIIAAARKGGEAGLFCQKICADFTSTYLFCRCCARVAQPLPPLPYDAYHLCIFSRHKVLEVVLTGISLLYGEKQFFEPNKRTDFACEPDFLAFLVIVFTAKRSRTPGVGTPSLLSIIATDATWYFLVIFTSHVVFAITLDVARVSIVVPSARLPLNLCLQETLQLLPAT